MTEALKAYRAKVAKQKQEGTYVAPAKLTPLERALANPGSLKLAIRAECLNCTSGSREEIENCMLEGKCGLWHVRPYRASTV